MLTILGTIAVWLGVFLLVFGAIAFLIAAFRQSLLWGLAVLFISPAAIFFLVIHWSRARNGFFLQLWGLGFMFVGAAAFHANLPWPLS